MPVAGGDTRRPEAIPDAERDYFLERKYPAFGNLVPRDVAARNAKEAVDGGQGVGPLANGVYLDFADSIARHGRQTIEERYGNLFEMYEKITGEDPYTTPMRIYPAPHYTMGGLWVDYDLMSNVDGLFVLGEANFSDHGANRLGASALMQGLADGYFIAPYTTASFLSSHLNEPLSTDTDAFRASEAEVSGRLARLLAVDGGRTVDSFHRELGRITWNACGISRTREGLTAAIGEIAALRERYWQDVKIAGDGEELNPSLEKAGRVADFFELAELMCRDALHREESCGGHFREEHQTPDGEARRDDERFAYAAAWEFTGDGAEPAMHKENLVFEAVEPSQRSYK